MPLIPMKMYMPEFVRRGAVAEIDLTLPRVPDDIQPSWHCMAFIISDGAFSMMRLRRTPILTSASSIKTDRRCQFHKPSCFNSRILRDLRQSIFVIDAIQLPLLHRYIPQDY
jgi:hypothetical protein